MGTLFGKPGDSEQHTWQSSSRLAKRATFRCFGPPLGRILGDLSADLGWNLNTFEYNCLRYALDLPGVFFYSSSRILRYSLSVPQLFFKASLGIPELFLRYSLGQCAVYIHRRPGGCLGKTSLKAKICTQLSYSALLSSRRNCQSSALPCVSAEVTRSRLRSLV